MILYRLIGSDKAAKCSVDSTRQEKRVKKKYQARFGILRGAMQEMHRRNIVMRDWLYFISEPKGWISIQIKFIYKSMLYKTQTKKTKTKPKPKNTS